MAARLAADAFALQFRGTLRLLLALGASDDDGCGHMFRFLFVSRERLGNLLNAR
jgi:hypothetical protein